MYHLVSRRGLQKPRRFLGQFLRIEPNRHRSTSTIVANDSDEFESRQEDADGCPNDRRPTDCNCVASPWLEAMLDSQDYRDNEYH